MAGPELTDQEKMALADAKARARAYVKGDRKVEEVIDRAQTREELRDGLANEIKANDADAIVFKMEDFTPEETVQTMPVYTPGGGTAYGDNTQLTRSGEVMDQEAAEIYAAREDAPNRVKDFVDKIASDTRLSQKDLIEVYKMDTVNEAMGEIRRIAGDDIDLNKAITDVAKDESKVISDKYLFSGERASREVMRAWGYEGEFSETHDMMVGNGYQVKVDADDNIFYIDPSRQVTDIMGESVGIYNPTTNVIDTLEHLPDTRAPIGMGTGTYIAEGEDVNVVTGRPEIALSAWYNLYGDKFVDQVTNEDWEDVLKAAGVSKPTIGALLARADEPTFTTTTSLHYQYLKGDDVNQFIDMPTEDFGAWQKRYADAGIYKIGKLGSFDPKFVAINEAVMTAANHNYEGDPDGMRKAWDDMVANPQLLDNWFGTRRGGGSTTSRVWRPPAYLAPDYAELSQAVKLTFEDKLGRAPSDAEVELLSTRMKADHRAEFDAQAAAQKMQFFASGGNSAGTVQDVNYAARFQENFEDRYSAELGTRDKIDMSRNITQQALGSILSADRAIGY